MDQILIEVSEGKTYEPYETGIMEEKRATMFEDLSIRFLNEAKHLYGGEKAAELGNAIKQVLGKEWSQKLILKMLVEGSDNFSQITFTYDPRTFNSPIHMIKAIRMASGMGLREAKDAYERLRDRVLEYYERAPLAPVRAAPCMRLHVPPIKFEEVQTELKQMVGIIIL